MDLKQMHEIEGVGMMDTQAKTVFDHYGLPAVIRARKLATAQRVTIAWHGTSMRVPDGDWEVIYSRKYRPGGDQRAIWHNPHQTISPRLDRLARLILYVQGNVGRMTVRRFPQKTTYDVPTDPLNAHKVISVRAEYRAPIPVAAITARYGSTYDTVTDQSPVQLMRYWVLRREGDVPLALYAVDFELNAKGDAVLACIASGIEAEFVLKKLQNYYDRWEENLYD
ncbi:MAG: hypothetical protein ACYDC8_11280 [Gammaproteobacteria bacterium]